MNKYIRQGCQEEREWELIGMSDKSTCCNRDSQQSCTMLNQNAKWRWGNIAQGSKVLWLTWGHRALDLSIPWPHSFNPPTVPIIQLESRPLYRQIVRLQIQGSIFLLIEISALHRFVNKVLWWIHKEVRGPLIWKLLDVVYSYGSFLHPLPLIFITNFTILWRPQNLRQLYPSVDSWPQQTFVWDVRMQFRIKINKYFLVTH